MGHKSCSPHIYWYSTPFHIMGENSTHRAECTRCLSGVIILSYLAKCTGIPIPTNLRISTISDNQGMIKSLTNRSTYLDLSKYTAGSQLALLEEIHQLFGSWASDACIDERHAENVYGVDCEPFGSHFENQFCLWCRRHCLIQLMGQGRMEQLSSTRT